MTVSELFKYLAVAALAATACAPAAGPTTGPEPDAEPRVPVFYRPAEFAMGADLSYVNQILDRGGVYADSAGVRDPYAIFADHGANVVRLRLWHDPTWVRSEAYGDLSVPLYSGLEDVARSIRLARAAGMQVLLDFHYSDVWADPGRQDVPAAWAGITSLAVLEDSVYRYTRGVLERLAVEGLLPEMVQTGNEINCGMLSTGGGASFPELSVCEGRWQSQGRVLSAGIRAVREVAPGTKVMLHVAQPENVSSWLEQMTTTGGVTDFDIIGFSYYARWSDQPLASIAGHVAEWRQKYGKAVMVAETAYPWTLDGADGYGNILGANALVDGYPATPDGQRRWLVDLVKQVIAGGGSGVFYWEPAWITSGLRDLWGSGSSWENAALFDFAGRVHDGMSFYTFDYGIR